MIFQDVIGFLALTVAVGTFAEVARYLRFVKGWDSEHLGTGVPFEFFQLMANELATVSGATRAVNEGRPAVLPSTSLGAAGRFRMRALALRRRASEWGEHASPPVRLHEDQRS